MSDSNRFEFLPLEERTIKHYKACFDQNGMPRPKENIEWQFFQNPIKSSIVKIAYDTTAQITAGIYATSNVKVSIQNNHKQAAQSLDTLVDQRYRGQKLFTSLAKLTYEDAKAADIPFIFGFPNGNSVRGFEKYLSWSLLDPVPFLIRPIRSNYFTNKFWAFKHLPNVSFGLTKNNVSSQLVIIERQGFPKEVNQIWKQFAHSISIAVIRDHPYLHWRYIQKPNTLYHIAHCYHEGHYLGFIVYTLIEKHGGRIGYIMELVFHPKFPKTGAELLKYATAQLCAQRADLILAWCFDHSPSFPAFRKNYFFKLPEILRPIKLHFGVYCIHPELTSLVKNRNNWYLSYSDSDTV